MQEFAGKVAVVTGAGGKVGFALGKRFAAEGMKVVLADVDANDLATAESQLKEAGTEVIAVQTDVTRSESVQALADDAVAAFGGVHVVCNNAGVNPQDLSIWEATEEDWRWALGVNLWGAIHGSRIFVPLMLAQGEEGHIVNTASAAGLGARPGMGSYVVSKTGIVALTEVLHHELSRIDAKVGCSVLCPGRVRGGGTKNRRPDEFHTPGDEAQARARPRDLPTRPRAPGGDRRPRLHPPGRRRQARLRGHPRRPLLHLHPPRGDQGPRQRARRGDLLGRRAGAGEFHLLGDGGRFVLRGPPRSGRIATGAASNASFSAARGLRGRPNPAKGTRRANWDLGP